MTIRNPKNRKKYSVEFIAVKENLAPLLGAKVIQQMKLIEIHEENFEKVATVSTTSATLLFVRKPRRPKKSLRNTVMSLKVILEH